MKTLILSLVVLSHVLTPGALELDANGKPLTTEFVCNTKWEEVPRHMDNAAVYRRYHVPMVEQAQYVIDHLISRMLGGSDTSLLNGWPEERHESYQKDTVERNLHDMVCGKGRYRVPVMTLQDAQRRIALNWRRATVVSSLRPIR